MLLATHCTRPAALADATTKNAGWGATDGHRRGLSVVGIGATLALLFAGKLKFLLMKWKKNHF